MCAAPRPRPLPAGWFERSPEDLGPFQPGSPVWRVHAARSGLIGGLRALLLQTMHPLAMAGVADHSDYRDDP
ncbi:MAG: oxygenase MpaB family protein [Acidimicrobiales bacterium]